MYWDPRDPVTRWWTFSPRCCSRMSAGFWREFVSGLGSFLLFALPFFVMMRFGCGAHVGHGGHEHGKQSPSADRDPVCGMPVAADRG
jgi:hypothetical protein